MDSKTPKKKMWCGKMYFVQNEVSWSSSRNGSVWVFSHFFLLNKIHCAVVKSPLQFAIRCFPDLSHDLVCLYRSLQRSNLKDFSFNCWNFVLTFPVGVSSVASDIGESTVSWYSEVAYSWVFFPFKMLWKVNRAVDTQYKIQSTCTVIKQFCKCV